MIIQSATNNIGQSIVPNRPPPDSTENKVGVVVSDVKPVSVDIKSGAVSQISVNQPVQDEQIKKAVENMNKVLSMSNHNLEFKVDDASKKQVVQIVDKETGDVIRQFPSKEAIEISKAIEKFQNGFLLRSEA